MKKQLRLITLCLIIPFLLSGCGKSVRLDPKNPVTITMWHNYGGEMQNAMNELIEEFNNSIGRQRGIIVSVTSVSASKDIQEKLFSIAAGNPGAPALPNLVTTYPKTALVLFEQGLLVPLEEQFTERKLQAYLPPFLDEGRLRDGQLYVFPIAKSTEVLFLNRTLFDRFAAATGVSIDNLTTFEGLSQTAIQYYEWTDSLTPDIANDGKAFFTADSWFNIAFVGIAQLGGVFVTPDHLNIAGDDFRRIWDATATPALAGGYAITGGYASDLIKTGEIICAMGSTAGILFYGDHITYPDNTIEATTFSILPCPVFDGGAKIAIQRGGVFGMVCSTRAEYALHFFYWLLAGNKGCLHKSDATGVCRNRKPKSERTVGSGDADVWRL